MKESRMDSNKKLSCDEWAVTLIRLGRHAEIIVEGVDESENYLCRMLHLTGYGTAPQLYSDIGYAAGVSPGYSSRGEIEICDFTTREKIRCDAKSPTWTISKATAEKMFETIKTEQQHSLVQFSLFGRHAIFNLIKQMLGFPAADSCCSWALNKLLHAGIKLKIDGDGFNLISYTDNYAVLNVKLETYTINDFCKFAKEGDIDAIRLNFSDKFNVNQLTKDACVGPVETFLGLYNPLALAVAYNKYDTVKFLVEAYNADPYQPVGRKLDHTAFDCATRNFWLVKEKPAKAILEYLTNLPRKKAESVISMKIA